MNVPELRRGRPVSARSVVVVLAVALLLTSCAAGANTAQGTGVDDGFWMGLWHGLISPVTFVISLFNDQVSVYEVHNNGGWYDFGFMVGVSAFFSGTVGSGARAGR